MREFLQPLTILVLSLAAAAPSARAASIAKEEHVTIRLLVEAPDASGRFRGAVLLDLAPGWKTYWSDPGGAGLPPRIEFSGPAFSEAPELTLPPPVRFFDGYATSNGYDAPVGFGFEGQLQELDGAEPLQARIEIGICETICIPVAASLSLSLDDLPGSDPLVSWAFGSLPEQVREGFSAQLNKSADRLTVSADEPFVGDDAELFVAGPAGWTFGVPEWQEEAGGGGSFEVPVLAAPEKTGSVAPTVDVLALHGEKAVLARGISVDIR